jgi:lysozyme family protein
MDAFDEAIAKLRPIEGGYTNDPSDSGGETNHGITIAVARAHGYFGPMKDMPRDEAVRIYHEHYWTPLALSTIAGLSKPIALELFDTEVNLPSGMAAKFLQRSLNVLNQGATLFKDIPVDGLIGAVTVATLRDYLGRRGGDGHTVLLRALNALQGTYYIELAERREKDEKFVYGWLLQRVVM